MRFNADLIDKNILSIRLKIQTLNSSLIIPELWVYNMSNVFLKKQGFTIIELIIIVMIIGILAGILVPTLSTTLNKAYQIECTNNMRQVFLAIEQYVNDNNGLLPRPNNSETSKDDTKTCTGEVWFKAIDRYLSVLIPPLERDEISLEERLIFVKQDPVFKKVPISERDTTRTIKMNMNLVQDSECQRTIEAVYNPTRTVLLFDGRINNAGVSNNFEGSYGSVAQRHARAANILFMDGHVERIQNGDSDGTTNKGWPNRQAGQELIWDPENPDLP